METSKLKKNFPILSRKINAKPLIYLDNAATSHKPNTVIIAVAKHYQTHNANIHRGIHALSVEATENFETVRDKVKKFINAGNREEIIFTSGATHGINLVATSLCSTFKKGGEIVVTEAEHHSNFLPWQAAAQANGLRLVVAPVSADGSIKATAIRKLISSKTRIVAVSHASNVTGAITDLQPIIKAAHRKRAVVLVDAAQSIPHIPVDVRALDVDFLVFSGHKILGPTGTGVLYAKKGLLNKMPPYQLGGHMVEKVTATKTTYAELPQKFEAGTANIAGVIGLGAALDYHKTIGYLDIKQHEKSLVSAALRKLLSVPGLRLIGPRSPVNRLAVFSFTIDGIPAHDIASLLDTSGIAVRAGHHCAQPLHEKFGASSSVRASFYFYNRLSDIDKLVAELKRIVKLFSIRTIRHGN